MEAVVGRCSEKAFNFIKKEALARCFPVNAFPEVVLYDIDYSGFFDVAFDARISSIVHFVVDRVAKQVLFVSVAEADDSPAPTP